MSISGQYPYLGSKETAAAIRKLLKAKFPATKFSVVTERGSMVSSVRIAWTDGPTARFVDSLVGCFVAGSFDGMTDSYAYDRDSLLELNGVRYRPGCKYVFTSRRTSIEMARRAAAQVAAFYGWEAPAIVPSGEYWYVDRSQDHTPFALVGFDWSSLIHQACEDRSRFVSPLAELSDHDRR